MTSEDILLIETTDRVRTITLNRPGSRNALSAVLRRQFFAALRDVDADHLVPGPDSQRNRDGAHHAEHHRTGGVPEAVGSAEHESGCVDRVW